MAQQSCSLVFAQGAENFCSHKNWHTADCIGFIFNFQNLETRKIFRWVDKQTVVHSDNEILFSAKEKWAIKPLKGREDLKCVLLNEAKQSEKAIYCIIPTI